MILLGKLVVLMGKGHSEGSMRSVLSKDSVTQSLSLVQSVDSGPEFCSVLSATGTGSGPGTDSMSV